MAIAARIKSLKYRQFLVLSKIFISKPLFTIPTLQATKETVKVCDDLFQHRHHGHNRTNAFRHALWTFLLCEKCYKVSKSEEKCASWAKKISDLHEKLSPNEVLEKEMDLHNNKVGIDLYLYNPRESNISSVLKKMMEEAIPVKSKPEIENSGGKLVYIETENKL